MMGRGQLFDFKLIYDIYFNELIKIVNFKFIFWLLSI